MSTPYREDVSLLIEAWAHGEKAALEHLVPRVYADLHRLAHSYMRGERPGHLLQTTALVNEAYLRLAATHENDCPDRSYFFSVCARVMRQVLVDWARTQSAVKRGGGLNPVEWNEAAQPDPHSDPGLVAIDDALNALAEVDSRKAQIVELRFFGGFSVEETAQALGVSPGTIARDWTIAKLFLSRELSGRSPQNDRHTIRTRNGTRPLG